MHGLLLMHELWRLPTLFNWFCTPLPMLQFISLCRMNSPYYTKCMPLGPNDSRTADQNRHTFLNKLIKRAWTFHKPNSPTIFLFNETILCIDQNMVYHHRTKNQSNIFLFLTSALPNPEFCTDGDNLEMILSIGLLDTLFTSSDRSAIDCCIAGIASLSWLIRP